ncbi:MAG: DUF4278 domain-containing protein [Leptolyngbyaceae cyanobacterium SM2_3_12]|nr:DUF4278 domain-containing protein [Leptolyngbyaceae cyanobacterium SM2_3_12]
MELAYRGAHYEVNLPPVEADGVEVIGTYRGAPFIRKYFHRQASAHAPVEMTYRGIKYIQFG